MSRSEWFRFWDARAQKVLSRYMAVRVAQEKPAERYELTALRGLLRASLRARGTAKRELRFTGSAAA